MMKAYKIILMGLFIFILTACSGITVGEGRLALKEKGEQEVVLEKYKLRVENIKDPKGFVDKLVKESYLRIETPSSHIMNRVLSNKERDLMISYSKMEDLNEKQVKRLRKLLNSLMGRRAFFNENAWYNRKVSQSVIELAEISKKEKLSRKELKNLNARALYEAYSDYFSNLEKWK